MIMSRAMSTLPANAPPSAADPGRKSKLASTLLNFLLQASHRLGAIALLATLATWAMIYLSKDFHVPLAITASCSNAGLCFALVSRLIARPAQPPRREANGVAFFNGILFLLALQLMLLARIDIIRAAATDFFTPSPPTASPH
jgi:hypothetical protein